MWLGATWLGVTSGDAGTDDASTDDAVVKRYFEDVDHLHLPMHDVHQLIVDIFPRRHTACHMTRV